METRSNDLWLIDILTVLLVLIITISPSINPLRIALGLPLVLFFPGYTLVAALFPRKESLGGVERIALSFGLSIAVVPLIGLILNYTPWGIRLYPILISLSCFILLMSGIAWHRRRRLAPDERFVASFNFRLPSWRGQSAVDKALSITLIIAIIGAIGTLGYGIATPKVGESFTEFYILGPEGKAEHYPETLKVGKEGKVVLGIVNHEHERVSYQVEARIDGEKAKLRIGGEDRDMIEVKLEHEEKWEKEVGFVPQKIGKKQEVEFVLYKEGEPYFKDPPHLWIDVEESRL